MRNELTLLLMTTLCTSVWAGEMHFSYSVIHEGLGVRPVMEGQADANQCRYLFSPPGIYDGRHIDIPDGATVFGVIAVTDGTSTRIVPLFQWREGAGWLYGCNGPTPAFAHRSTDKTELVDAVLSVIRRKAQP